MGAKRLIKRSIKRSVKRAIKLKGLFPPFSESLVAYFDGTNASDTTKTDLKNGNDMTATDGTCLTLAIGDTVEAKGHGGLASNTGDATFTYDGVDLTCDGAGTLYEFAMGSGAVFAAMEGVGDGTNDTIISVDGLHTATVTAAAGLATAWGSTQDTDFRAMKDGYWTDDVDPLIQYPSDPTTATINMFQFEVVGDSTLTVDGTAYSVGVHTIAGLSGVTTLTVTYGGTDDQTVFTGVDSGDVTGSSPNFSIDIDESKVLVATMSEESSAVATYKDYDDAVESSASNTITVDVPALTSDGDMMVMSTLCDNSNDVITTPTGWDRVNTSNLSNSAKAYVFSRVASSEPASYTLTGSYSDTRLATITTIEKSGGDWAAIDSSENDNAGGGSITSNPVTGLAGGILLAYFYSDGPTEGVTTPPADMVYLGASDKPSIAIRHYYEEPTTASEYQKSIELVTTEQNGAILVAVGAE